MKKNAILYVALMIAMAGFSCKKNNEGPVDTGFLHGAFITNEGLYDQNNGSVSYLDLDSSYIINNIFQAVNGYAPGDVIQSFGVSGNKGLIVANHSAKVEIVDLQDFTLLGTITGADYPRYVLGLSDTKAYLTDGAFQGQVYVLDLTSQSIVNQIPVGKGPENLVLNEQMVYVANSGGWDYDNSVSVIDPSSDQVVNTIPVGDNPTDLVVDANHDVWVLCKGKVVYDQNWNVTEETASKLALISRTGQTVTRSFPIGQTGDYFNPIRLAISGDGTTLYWVEHDGVYKMQITDSNPPQTPFIHRSFYGLDVDPATGLLYTLDARGFSGQGTLLRYTPDGTLVDSVTVGIAPNGVFFN